MTNGIDRVRQNIVRQDPREYGKEGPEVRHKNSTELCVNVPVPGSGEEPTMVQGEVNES